MSIRYCTTKGYCLYLKLFKYSLLANTITTYSQANLVSRKQESLLAKNNINQALKNVDTLIKGCNVCLALKTVRYKPYGNFKALLISIH